MSDEIAIRYGPIGAAQVWKAWRDKMLEQGRTVKQEFMEWPIPEADKTLDAYIAEQVVDDFLVWVSAHWGLRLENVAALRALNAEAMGLLRRFANAVQGEDALRLDDSHPVMVRARDCFDAAALLSRTTSEESQP